LKTEVIVLIALITCSIPLYGKTVQKRVLVLPFKNIGSIEYENLSDLIPTYFFSCFKDLPDYDAVSLFRVKKYLNERGYKHIGLENHEILYQLAEDFSLDLIIGGQFTANDDELITVLFIYNPLQENLHNEIVKGPVKTPIIYTLDSIFLSIIQKIARREIESAILSVLTDHACNLFIDGELYGVTPMRMRVSEGEHDIRICHVEKGGEEEIYHDSMTVKAWKDETIDIPVFIYYEAGAEEECTVYINDEKKGKTPFHAYLYSGREYAVRLIYTDPEGMEHTAYNNIVSTKDYTPLPSLHVPALGAIHVTADDYPFFCTLDNGSLIRSPHSFTGLSPDIYKVQVVLKDHEWKKNWIFYNKRHTLYAYQEIPVDLSGFEFEYNPYLCLLPSLAQFHNRQPAKGSIMLSLFAGFLVTAGVSTALNLYFYQAYEDKAIPFSEDGLSSGYTQGEVDEAYLPVAICNYLITGGFIAAGLVYLYSAIDGIIVMDHVNKLFQKE
jgi:hypothetical protein